MSKALIIFIAVFVGLIVAPYALRMLGIAPQDGIGVDDFAAAAAVAGVVLLALWMF